MKEIPLTQGKVALLDDADYENVARYKWHAYFDGYNWYAQGFVNGREISMHRFLAGATLGTEIDHRDRNGLNNQRSNFRACTHSQNSQNRFHPKANKSGFKGVSWLSRRKKWRATITKASGWAQIGLFDSPVEAAKAYDSEALKNFGEFALTNSQLGLL